MAADDERSSSEGLLRIEINPPLPCGICDCGLPARTAHAERDPQYPALWRLLPICEVHLASLIADAAEVVAAADAEFNANVSAK